MPFCSSLDISFTRGGALNRGGALKLSSIWGSCSPTDSSFSSLPQACQILGNYSSLRAILAALQSASIHRLQRTWDNVSRKSFRTFQKLCREDNPQGRELLIKVAREVQGSKDRRGV